jgi:Asp/Glu/hydantoin racemase
MRILLINPNTTAAMTERMVAEARRRAPAGVTFVGATGRFGARYIASRAAAAIAGHAALDAFAEHGGDCQAVLLACFGDPGLDALKEIAGVPVLGLAEASCAAALRFGGRFSIVTGGERWKPMLTEFVAAHGWSARLASVRTVAPTGAAIAANPEGALSALAGACRDCVERDGAAAVVLGGAGLVGLAERLAPAIGVPILCSVATGIDAILAAARADARSSAETPPVETVGLPRHLARFFGA